MITTSSRSNHAAKVFQVDKEAIFVLVRSPSSSQYRLESLYFSNSAIQQLRSTQCRRCVRTVRSVGTKVQTSGEDTISRVRKVVVFRSSLCY